MTKTAHTPGPWRVDPRTDRIVADSMSVGKPVVLDVARTFPRRGKQETDANARLIAAAPEVSDALRKLINEVAGLGGFGPEIKALIGVTNWNVLEQRVHEARAAIAKAEGRS